MINHILLKQQGSKTTVVAKNLSYNNAMNTASRRNTNSLNTNNARYFVVEQQY